MAVLSKRFRMTASGSVGAYAVGRVEDEPGAARVNARWVTTGAAVAARGRAAIPPLRQPPVGMTHRFGTMSCRMAVRAIGVGLASNDPSSTHPIALKLRPRWTRGGRGRAGGSYGRHGRGRFSDSSRWRHRGGAGAYEPPQYCDRRSEDEIFHNSHCYILPSGPGAPVNTRGSRRIENSSLSKDDGSAVAVSLRKWLPRNFSMCSSWWWTDSCYPAHRRSWMSTQAARSSWTHKNRLVSRTSRNSVPVRE